MSLFEKTKNVLGPPFLLNRVHYLKMHYVCLQAVSFLPQHECSFYLGCFRKSKETGGCWKSYIIYKGRHIRWCCCLIFTQRAGDYSIWAQSSQLRGCRKTDSGWWCHGTDQSREVRGWSLSADLSAVQAVTFLEPSLLSVKQMNNHK